MELESKITDRRPHKQHINHARHPLTGGARLSKDLDGLVHDPPDQLPTLESNTGFLAQEAIYLKKYLEAQRLVDQSFSKEAVAQSPYVVSYADLCGISVEKATAEILLQAKLDHEFLAKTELLRLRFFSRVRRAASDAEIIDILASFRSEASS